MLKYLEIDLVRSLNEAKSVSIAVALIKDYGFKIIENSTPPSCKRKYILGIHLPTPPNILRRFLALQNQYPGEVESRIYSAGENYHPKVYIIEKQSGELIAFVGSANATRGGLTHNIEMSIAITNPQECERLQNWFDGLFNSSKLYDEAYIAKYEISYKRNRALASTQKSNIDQVINDNTVVSGNNLIVNAGQFFRQSDYDAFAVITQKDTSDAAVELRAEVRERLIDLGESIMPSFPDYGITDLHLPYRRNLYTSQHFHSRGNDHIDKESIWLNFGKSRTELNRYEGKFYQSFVNHQRIQVILRNSASEAYIGIWLYISKHNSSYFDRKHLKEELQNQDFVERLYEYVLQLGGSYWMMMGDDDDMNVSDLKSSTDLKNFLEQDNYKQEIIIGRNFLPNDDKISEENIVETVLLEFSKLYKIYNLIKAPFPIANSV